VVQIGAKIVRNALDQRLFKVVAAISHNLATASMLPLSSFCRVFLYKGSDVSPSHWCCCAVVHGSASFSYWLSTMWSFSVLFLMNPINIKCLLPREAPDQNVAHDISRQLNGHADYGWPPYWCREMAMRGIVFSRAGVASSTLVAPCLRRCKSWLTRVHQGVQGRRSLVSWLGAVSMDRCWCSIRLFLFLIYQRVSLSTNMVVGRWE
jgi:hypothetical protein